MNKDRLVIVERVSLYADGSFRVSHGIDAAIDASHPDFVRSLTVGDLLDRLNDAAGMADRALTRTDMKLTATDYRSVLGFIRTVASVFALARENEMSGKRDEFAAGYLIAVANIMNLHDDPVIAEDVLLQLGVDKSVLRGLGLCEYDLKPLRKLFSEIERKAA